jgi:hypothetical protein
MEHVKAYLKEDLKFVDKRVISTVVDELIKMKKFENHNCEYEILEMNGNNVFNFCLRLSDKDDIDEIESRLWNELEEQEDREKHEQEQDVLNELEEHEECTNQDVGEFKNGSSKNDFR